jgi:hypothetical protein
VNVVAAPADPRIAVGYGISAYAVEIGLEWRPVTRCASVCVGDQIIFSPALVIVNTGVPHPVIQQMTAVAQSELL